MLQTVKDAASSLKALFVFLRSFAPGFQLILGMLALGVAILAGSYWLPAQDTMVRTLLRSLAYDGASKDYKALEAAILSSIDDEGRDTRGQRRSDDFDRQLKKVAEHLKQSAPCPAAPAEPTPGGAHAPTDVSADQLRLNIDGGDDLQAWQQFLMRGGQAPEPDVFLFVPGLFLHKDDGSNSIRQADLAELLGKDQRIRCDISGALNLRAALSDFVGIKIWDGGEGSIVQSYFITTAGVTLLKQAGVADQQAHYKKQFDGSTFFLGRPYFLATLKDRLKRRKDAGVGIDYSTQPYIDMGTNGAVRTHCAGFVKKDTPGTSDAVLCVDEALPEAQERIRGMLEKELAATVVEVHCYKTNRGCTDRAVSDELRELKADEDRRLLGAIYVYPEVKEGRLTFTVPIQTTRLSVLTPPEKHPTLDTVVVLLKATVDLKGWRDNRLFVGGAFFASVILFLATVFNLLFVYWKRKRESDQLLRNLDHVMSCIDEPYVRVDPDDKIQTANRAFKDFLGRDSVEDTDLRRYLHPESKQEYEAQKSKREHGLYSSYPLTFETKSGHVKIEMHGLPLPVPKEFKKRVPDRFGILTVPKDTQAGDKTPAPAARKRVK